MKNDRIAIGSSKCKLNYHPAHNDMSHFFTSYFDVPYYGYVSREYWEEIKELQGLSISSLIDEDRVKNFIKRYGGTVAQFNAQHPDGKNYIRMVAVMGEQWINPWTNYEIKIKLPFLRVLCYCLNKLWYFKQRKEQREWDEWLNKMYEDRQ